MYQALPQAPAIPPLSMDTNLFPPLSPVSTTHSQASLSSPDSIGVSNTNAPSAGNLASPQQAPLAQPQTNQSLSRPSTSGDSNTSTPQNANTTNHIPKAVRAISWWWWWEIGSSLLSMISMSLILAILFAVNEKPLSNWTLAIQPNSLISVSTTVGKTAMMVSVTSCVSHLKWRHFQLRSQKMSHLQLFDDASRGPWGAFLLLIGVRSRAFLAWIFAVITIVGLAIEPSAQQILDFPQRVARLENVTATIGRAENYYSRAFVEGQRTFSNLPRREKHCREPALMGLWQKT